MTTDTSSPTAAPAWGRRRLLAALAGAVAGVLVLTGGLVYAVVYALNPPTPATNAGPAPIVVPAGTGLQYRDTIAAAPMLTVPPQASRPGALAADPGPAIAIPPATAAGPGGVPSGFPHTPEGAVGQLGAIDATVLTGMNLAAAEEVHREWSLEPDSGSGGAGDGWVMTAAVAGFLTAAKVPELTPGMSVVATPVAAQVKGVDGPDWVLACVLLAVEATIATTSQVAFGHCERMAWTKDTWLIDPGPAPVAPAPSTWPGSQVAIDAGWATWATPVGE